MGGRKTSEATGYYGIDELNQQTSLIILKDAIRLLLWLMEMETWPLGDHFCLRTANTNTITRSADVSMNYGIESDGNVKEMVT